MSSNYVERQRHLFVPEDYQPTAPVLVSACFLGIPCRWHGRRPKRRDKLLARLKKHSVLVPVCPGATRRDAYPAHQ